MIRKLAALAVLPLIALTACGAASSTDGGGAAPAETKTINVGFIPGPYADMFKKAIKPTLETQGYTVNIKEISDFTVPNQSTMSGELNMTIFQNDAFMNVFNSQSNGDLVSVLHIPSAPLGLYVGRGKAKKPADIESNTLVALSSEASSLARSLTFLQTEGLVTVGPVPSGKFATPSSLTANPKSLQFRQIDAPQIPRSLPDVDYAVALGNHVYASGTVKLSDAIALEKVPEASQIIVSVRKQNQDAPWTKAVVDAFKSPEFRAYLEGDTNLAYFTKPSWW